MVWEMPLRRLSKISASGLALAVAFLERLERSMSAFLSVIIIVCLSLLVVFTLNSKLQMCLGTPF